MEQDQDPQNQRPMPSQKPARELKVEDALLYLDQVKMEFSDKPQIYNEFLDIMKNFKAQSINTPGVIERVKNLFRGYNKLILGFNTFLPEGEGYKIELTAEEQAFNHPGQEVPAHGAHMMGSSGVSVASGGAPSAGPGAAVGAHPGTGAAPGSAGAGGASGFPVVPGTGAMSGYYSGAPGGSTGTLGPQGPGAPGASAAGMGSQQQGGGPGGVPPAGSGMPGAPGGGPQQQPGQMQQAHAIHYVTKIRNRFASEPDTYRSFLKILHTYQKEQKGIKEVLEQVSQLFADHPDLLMEFTYFLPDAVQEQAKERLHRAARESEARRIARMQAANTATGKPPGPQRKGAGGTGGPMSNMPPGMMRGPNGEFLMGNMMGGNAAMMVGDGLGPGGMTGNKRSRAERDAMRAAAAGGGVHHPAFTPQQQQNYAMQLAAAGLDETQRKNLMSMHMSGAFGPMGGMGPGVGGPPQQKKVNRRKNAAIPPGMMMMSDGSLSMAPAGMADAMKGPGGFSHQQQMMLLQQHQQGLAQQMLQQQHHAQQQAQQIQRSKEALMSVSAERRYFEQVKEVLTATSRETWQDFVKVLELFSNDVVSKEDLLDLVADLFGPQHNDLFHEFKRLLSSREEFDEHKSDVWYAVPLSEIDFTQCRKCSPSYRALPKDFPKAKCTERSEEEAKMLNDQWVSIPIGSEESYSFKHMRKNQYEEALFKVEDERFEIDMVIDSNMCTIRMLEPLAEEILNMRLVEGASRAGANGDVDANGNSATGSGGNGLMSNVAALGASSSNIAPRFSFQLEKRHLSTIHLNSIARIYGDHGEEILELLRRNPAGTIPVLLKRLKQKDLEWRKARTELNKHWRDVVEKNHAKSFDHRSFYFRQQDKKYMSTRQLVNEITTLANPPAVVPITTAPSSSGAAAASSSTSVSDSAAVFEDPENTGLFAKVTAEAEPLLAGMSPHIVLNYENDAHLVHRDVYRVMCHAAESTLSSSADKERLAALWRDLLRVFFNVPVHYLYATGSAAVPSPTVTKTSATAIDSSAMNVDTAVPLPAVPVGAYKLSASDAWPTHTKVVTAYGSGEVMSFREMDSMYAVKLDFGVAYLSPSTIYGSEQLSSNALFVIGVTPSEKAGEADVIYNNLVNNSTSSLTSDTVRDPSKLFFGTQMCYIFLRLHHAMFVRLRIARKLAAAATMANRNLPTGEVHHTDTDEERSKPVYNYFLGQLLALVEGNLDNARFEEFCRTLLGNKSYMLYTMDKLVAQAVKHLQAMANDENVTKLVGLFVYHHHHNGNNVDPVVYRDHVACILSHTMEDVFRIQLMASPETGTSTGSSQVGVQHLGILVPPAPATETEEIETAESTSGSAMTVDTSAIPVPPPATGSPRATASAMAITASLRARGGSMVSVTGILDPGIATTSTGASGANTRLTVDGKTPKAVVSDDEGSDSDSEAEARTASMGEQGEDDDGGSEGDTDDAPARSSSRNNRSAEVNTRQGLYSPSASRRASLSEYPADK